MWEFRSTETAWSALSWATGWQSCDPSIKRELKFNFTRWRHILVVLWCLMMERLKRDHYRDLMSWCPHWQLSDFCWEEIHYGCVCFGGGVNSHYVSPFIPLLLNWLAVINELIMCVQRWWGAWAVLTCCSSVECCSIYLSYSNFPLKPSPVLTGYILGVWVLPYKTSVFVDPSYLLHHPTKTPTQRTCTSNLPTPELNKTPESGKRLSGHLIIVLLDYPPPLGFIHLSVFVWLYWTNVSCFSLLLLNHCQECLCVRARVLITVVKSNCAYNAFMLKLTSVLVVLPVHCMVAVTC